MTSEQFRFCSPDDFDEGDSEKIEDTKSQIQEFYKDQTVFITGATGFLGTLLVEKLIRCCPQIRKLILLVRGRGNKSIEERVRDYFNEDVFDYMRLANPDYYQKVNIVNGQLDLDRLGLSSEEEQLLISQTSIVFHVAATVNFDEHIRDAYSINVKGTETLLLLAKHMKRLKSFIHVSTAFSNSDRQYIEEKFYPPTFTSGQLANLISSASHEEMAILNQHILEAQPNTYTLTKATAEDLVREAAQKMPIWVFRPSIVMPTLMEPMPLWMKGFNGLLAISMATGIGLNRVLLFGKGTSSDMVPGDRTINAMVALAWYQTTLKFDEQRHGVLNYVSCRDNRITFSHFLDVMQHSLHISGESCDTCLWKSNIYYTDKINIFFLLFYIMHVVPAVVFTLVEKLTNRKPRVMKAYRKIFHLTGLVKKFALTQFVFTNQNMHSMVDALSEVDGRKFDCSMSNFQWEDMIVNIPRSIAVYCKDRFTKKNFESRMIYIFRVDDGLNLLIKFILVYFILNLLAQIINTFYV